MSQTKWQHHRAEKERPMIDPLDESYSDSMDNCFKLKRTLDLTDIYFSGIIIP